MWRTWEDENWTQNFSQNLKVRGYLGPRAYVTGYYSCPSVILIPGWFGQFWANCSPVFPFEIIYYSTLLLLLLLLLLLHFSVRHSISALRSFALASSDDFSYLACTMEFPLGVDPILTL
jgi:hypothetical protein